MLEPDPIEMASFLVPEALGARDAIFFWAFVQFTESLECTSFFLGLDFFQDVLQAENTS